MSEIHTTDHLKTVHEALCVAQAAIGNFPDRPTNWPPYLKVLQNLINDIDRQRPLGSNGKHGNLHTDTCGCDDRPPATSELERLRHENDMLHAQLDEVKQQRDTYAALR